MISNQILQNTIDGLKGITRIDLCIIDVEGKVLAATFPEADKYMEPALAFVESPADSQVVNGYQFFKVFDDHQLEYILLANGDSDDVYMVGCLSSSPCSDDCLVACSPSTASPCSKAGSVWVPFLLRRDFGRRLRRRFGCLSGELSFVTSRFPIRAAIKGSSMMSVLHSMRASIRHLSASTAPENPPLSS